MANCCRIYVNAPIDVVKQKLGEIPAVIGWGKDAIVPASESYFGIQKRTDLAQMIEVNFLNEVNLLLRACKTENLEVVAIQDLDGYGPHRWFTVE